MSDKKTILIVEDEPTLQKVISTKLNISGFNTLTAKSVAEAMSRLYDSQIDVIWLDHYLIGQENGLDFVIKLKADDSKWKEVPIFVVSNTATQEKVLSYLKLGVNNYYTKAEYSLERITEDIKKLFN